MLSFENKIKYFKNYISIKNGDYGDVMKDEIYFHFFENEKSFDFLNGLKSKTEIEEKVQFLVSKMIRHEHEDGLTNIISNYI